MQTKHINNPITRSLVLHFPEFDFSLGSYCKYLNTLIGLKHKKIHQENQKNTIKVIIGE